MSDRDRHEGISVCVKCVLFASVNMPCAASVFVGFLCCINLDLHTPPPCYVSVCAGSDKSVYPHTDVHIWGSGM